jgi:hypothetical protein
MTYKEWKGMDKKAGFFGLIPGAVTALGDTKNLAIYLLAAAAGVGGAAGFLGAKLNAHDKQDIDTIQKEYENERLKSDLGYLSAQAKAEAEAMKNKTAPKAARIFA